jgi:MFS family permease
MLRPEPPKSFPENADPITRHNVRTESLFSAFNGIYLGLAIFVAPVVAVTAFEATPLELTILVSAFPVGAFLGPLWAYLGRHWGMKQLVTQMALWANIPLFLIFWLDRSDAALFTALITVSQLLNSAMRMGQSNLYGILYAKNIRGRVLGRLTFWQYVTMVPSILITGWLLDKSADMCRVLYPLAGLCGLIGTWYYGMLQVDKANLPMAVRPSLRASVRGVQRIILHDRAYLLFQFAFFLSGSAFFMSTHIVLLLTREQFGFGAFELSLWLSVVPQMLLAAGSPTWGHIVDRFGIVRCRLLISLLMTGYLASYLCALAFSLAPLIYLGSVLQGLSNGGGQLTWSLASSHFAPRLEDMPLYNGIHFVLNGIRGLVMPWVGSILFVVLSGPMAILSAMLLSLGSIPIVLRTLQHDRGPESEALLRVVSAEEAEKSAG